MFSRRRSYDLAGVLVAVCGGCSVTTVLAQDAGNPEDNVIEEIYVTAQKRAQRLVDVPVSITALTEDDISERGLTNAEDYLRGVPGVNQVGNSNAVAGQAIIIRGLETTTGAQSYYSGATVGTYFGETPTTGSQGLLGSNVDIKLVDIQRVEVLRGPQGTSFGSSSVGGTVRTIPVAPELDAYSAQIGADYSLTSGPGDYNYKLDGVANLPLVEGKFAIRAVGYSHEESGYYRNTAASNPQFQAAIAPWGVPQNFATDEAGLGDYYARGGRLSALFAPTDALRFTVNYLNQKSETDGSPLQNVGQFEQVMLRLPPEHAKDGNGAAFWDADIEIANAVVEYDLGWADVLGTYSKIDGGSDTAYTVFGPFFPLALGARPVSFLANMSHDEDVGELRLVTKLDGSWNFLAGVYTESKDDAYLIPSTIWYGSGASNPYAANVRMVGTQTLEYDMKQTAAFGEATWEFAPKFALTGGVRAFDFERNDRSAGTGPFWGNYDIRGSIDTSDEIFRANLSFKPQDDSLVYAGWSQGFRLGRAQGLSPPNCDANSDGFVDGMTLSVADAQQVRSDTVDSFEVGGKIALAGGRVYVDAAVFRMDWKDIPVNVRPVATCPLTINAAEARSEGVELQARIQATDSLSIDIGGSYIKAELTDDVTLAGFREGFRLPAPEQNANLGIQQDFTIGGGEAFVRLDAIYIGDFFGNLNMTPNTYVDSYTKLDARARVTIKNVKVDLYVDNLTDADDFTSRSHYTFGGPEYGYRLRPRTIGMHLTLQY
jgi:outer membrane receptor protein involved in Fe transport